MTTATGLTGAESSNRPTTDELFQEKTAMFSVKNVFLSNYSMKCYVYGTSFHFSLGFISINPFQSCSLSSFLEVRMTSSKQYVLHLSVAQVTSKTVS